MLDFSCFCLFGIAAEEGQKLDISAKVGAGEDAEVALFTYLTTVVLYIFNFLNSICL